MIGDMQNQMDKELVAWIDTIPFSKPAKMMRDFSDAVLMAEVLKMYYPRYVELHNYVPASNLNMKKENWNTLNRKVLAKLDMKLNKDTIHNLANASQGAIEKLLSELKIKIQKEGEEMKSKYKCNAEGIDIQTSKEKIDINPSDENCKQINFPTENSNKVDTNNEIREFNPSKLTQLKQGIFIIFNWIVCFMHIWNIFNYCKLPRFKDRDNALADVATKQIENMNNETVPRAIYIELKQNLREKEEIICTLNHKIAYLESSVKLKDLRLSSLMTRILQNAVEMDHLAKSQLNEGTRAKLCSRTNNFHETKTN